MSKPPEVLLSVKRLMKAAMATAVEVTVLRRDLELLLTVWMEKKGK
jgi:hypothetical protein